MPLKIDPKEENDKVCPECGESMVNKDPYAHSLSHYPDYLDPARASKKAIKVQSLIRGGGVPLEVYHAMKGEGG